MAVHHLASVVEWMLEEVNNNQHNQHGACHPQPEAGNQYLPDNQSLAGRKADHDAEPIDYVKDDRTNREKERQQAEARRHGKGNRHKKAQNAQNYDANRDVV
jgi:hypothetical protein